MTDKYCSVCTLKCSYGAEKQKLQSSELLEKLAELEHEQWWKWSEKLKRDEPISEQTVKRWQHYWKPYSELTEIEKEQDRVWARKVLKRLEEALK
jgi:hypothetical protein